MLYTRLWVCGWFVGDGGAEAGDFKYGTETFPDYPVSVTEAGRLFSLLAAGDPCLSLLKYPDWGRLSCEGYIPELISIQQTFTKPLPSLRVFQK